MYAYDIVHQGAWTGLEYPFAGLALYEGLNDIALKGVTVTVYFVFSSCY